MIAITYASELTNFSFDKMDEILAASDRNNVRDDITGALVYNTEFALQCLEGPAAAIKAAFSRICEDDRHRQVKLLSVRNIRRRQFPDWSMRACVVEGETLRGLKIIPHIPLVGFRPTAWSEKDALTFVGALSDHLTQTRSRPSEDDAPRRIVRPRPVGRVDPVSELEQRIAGLM